MCKNEKGDFMKKIVLFLIVLINNIFFGYSDKYIKFIKTNGIIIDSN